MILQEDEYLAGLLFAVACLLDVSDYARTQAVVALGPLREKHMNGLQPVLGATNCPHLRIALLTFMQKLSRSLAFVQMMRDSFE